MCILTLILYSKKSFSNKAVLLLIESNCLQDFKSSFKMCVSQGLKSSMQTAGCIISLYLTSAKMTIILAVALPAVMLTGTFIGSALRKISK